MTQQSRDKGLAEYKGGLSLPRRMLETSGRKAAAQATGEQKNQIRCCCKELLDEEPDGPKAI